MDSKLLFTLSEKCKYEGTTHNVMSREQRNIENIYLENLHKNTVKDLQTK